MALEGLDHYTIRVRPQDLPEIRRFYVEVLGLGEGERPGFSFPGHWLYCGGRPVVHLAGTAEGEAILPGGTGRLDHVAFHASGLRDMLEHLRSHAIDFEQRPVPGQKLHQLFLIDPNGIKVELNYDAREARELAP